MDNDVSKCLKYQKRDYSLPALSANFKFCYCRYPMEPSPEYNPRREQRGHYYEPRGPPRHDQRQKAPRHEPYNEVSNFFNDKHSAKSIKLL